jgi:hypothetical protein
MDKNVIHKVLDLVRRPIGKFREINRRYAKPRTHMSRAVKISLLLLRLYLLFLVLIVVYRLIISLR